MRTVGFGAVAANGVLCQQQPAGQGQPFPSAVGASAERRIGPRRSFFAFAGSFA
jgi:hypothetical protein